MPKINEKADQLLAQLTVFGALEDGDVGPLVDYLRNGGEIAPAMRQHLAAMLEHDGDSTYRFILKGRQTGELGWSAMLAANNHKMCIGMFMERRVRTYGKSGYESALTETKKEFKVGKTTVEKAHKHVRDVLRNYGKRGMWEHYNEVYPDP